MHSIQENSQSIEKAMKQAGGEDLLIHERAKARF